MIPTGLRPGARVRIAALIAVLLALVGAAGAGRAQSAAPPTTPILRIETGRHSAPITHLATDRAERFVATASLDKTIRIWDAGSGVAIRTLRVPIGPGPEGALYSVAIAPDGGTLLATGYTGGSWGDGFSIYVMDPVRGVLKTRLAHLPELVNDVAFSSDGASFAAAFSGHNGLAVWDAKTGKLLAQDHDYGDIAVSVGFDPAGRIATASHDGWIRLYDGAAGGFALKAKIAAPSGHKPHSVAFSPDGRLVAVGYEDALAVDLLNAGDLTVAGRADVTGITGGNLASVGWIATEHGDRLAAGGTARTAGGRVLVRLWDGAGTGGHRDIDASADSIAHVLGVRNGLLFAAADPVWGRIDAAGSLAWRAERPTADFRDIADGKFAVSADGAEILFGTRQGGVMPLVFDASALTLAGSAGITGVAPGATKAAGIAVTGWRNDTKPMVNNRLVALAPEETARSAAVLPGSRRALIGTDSHLHLVDETGRALASEALPAAVWGVVPSGDGKFAVAALGDGTLRWYALDGATLLEERLALFTTPEGHDWIAWTTDGHFAHGETGGADLAGYHLNRSARESPRWVAFSQLYQLYYAPDFIHRRLSGMAAPETRHAAADPGQAQDVLEKRAPPAIELVDYCLADRPQAPCQPITPNVTRGFVQVAKVTGSAAPAAPSLVYSDKLPDGATKVRLRYRVTARQGGVGDVDLFVNGRVVSNTRGFVQVAGTQPSGGAPAPAEAGLAEVAMTLEPGSNLVNLRAYDSSDAVEERSPSIELVTTTGSGGRAGGGASTGALPTLYVLGVGVDQYPPPNRLRFAVKDMSDVVATIKAHTSANYARFEPILLTDHEASLAGLGQALDQLAAKVTERDTVVIYLAGHGFIDDSSPTKPYYYILQDVDPARPAATSASQGFLKEKLTRIKSKNVLLFLDTCHAGALAPETFDRVHNYFGQIYILAAASSDQQALDSYKDTNGPFAYAVIEGLNGKAAHDGVVDDHALGTYVKKELPRLVDEVQPNHHQSASFKMAGGEIEDFPLTEVRP